MSVATPPAAPVKAAISAMHTNGAITAIDKAKHCVTLEGGKVYHIDAKLDLTKFKTGDKVKLTYTDTAGVMTASEMKSNA